MATYKSTQVTNLIPAKHGIETITSVGTFTVSTNLAAADVIQMVSVPKGAVICEVTMATSASLGTTLTASLGDGASTARYAASGTFGQGAASMTRLTAAGGVGYTYTADDTVDIVIVTAATPVTGATITVIVQYIVA